VPQKIRKELLTNPQKPANGIVEGIAQALKLGGAAAPQPIGSILSIAGTVMSFTTDLANNGAGDSQVIDITTTVEGLEKQAVDSFTAQKAALGTMFRFIYQDWGKIEALGSKLNNPDDKNWAWSEEVAGQALQRMQAPTEVSYYRSILPTVYALGQINNSRDLSPQKYLSSEHFASYQGIQFCQSWYPFSNYKSPEQYLSSKEINDSSLWHVQPLGRRDIADGGCAVHNLKKSYVSLSPAILDHLFGTKDGQLAVYKPDFYRHWEFPRATCDPAGLDPKNIHSTGCDWTGAKLSGPAIAAVIAPHSTTSPQLNPQASTSLDSEEATTSPGAEASALSYSWQVLGGEATISDGDTATPTVEFTSGPGTYIVRVTVTDSNGAESTGETTVVYEEQ